MKTKKPLIIFVVLLIVIGCGVIGTIIGSGLGANTDNYATCDVVGGVANCTEFHSFVYLGEPGHEGGGLLGQHLGIVAGLLIGVYIWKNALQNSKKKSK